MRTAVIVDDHASVRRSLERLLRSVGIETVTYESAEDFQAAGRPDHTACLVLDVRLPRSSGIELQDRLRRKGFSIPIVFITGHGDVSLTVRAMKAGAIDFLVKPFDDDEFLAAVEKALEQDKVQRERDAEESYVRDLHAQLTPREAEVFELVVTGMLNKQIAMQLGVSEKTVKVHRGQVMRKMEAGSVPDLVRAHSVLCAAA